MPGTDNPQPPTNNGQESVDNKASHSLRPKKDGKQKTENGKSIPLFYWSSIKFEGKQKENYGDLLSKYLVEKISGRAVKFVQPKKQPWYKWNKEHFLAVGSIIHHATKDSIVWGSGIIDRKQQVADADFRAVRGPKTREFLLNSGYDCPEVYGDPALLLPNFYNPILEKRHKIGIVPHYVDYQQVKSWYAEDKYIKVVDLLTNDIEATTNEILECETIISSSLHGLIVAHTYGIPAVWVKFSNRIFGDDVKYADYFASVGVKVYNPESISTFPEKEKSIKLLKYLDTKILPKEYNIDEVRQGLLKTFPI